MAVTGFFELTAPASDGGGGLTDWCMRNVGGESYYLLNHTPHVGELDVYQNHCFYFDLESSAHAHAAGYYMNHGKTYPYEAEWIASITRESGGSLVADDSAESQTMEFV